MKAFAVELPPGTILIRVGADTDQWGKRYDYALPMLPDGTLVGLSKNPEEFVGKFTPHHMRAITDLVTDELGLEWGWDRLNHDNHRTIGRKQMTFRVKVSVEIEKDEKPFAASQCVYSNMDYDTMQLTQKTVIEALLALGNAKVGKK